MQPDAVLEMLSVIALNEGVTQRSLAARVGIAVGLVNLYVRRCIRKGWIKVRKVSPRRYSYFLTPAGIAEKSRLTQQYLVRSLDFFRQARSECRTALVACERRGWRRVVLYGTGDLADIATLAARETAVELVGAMAHEPDGRRLPHMKELSACAPLRDADAILITETGRPQDAYERLLNTWPPERVLTLPLLRVLRTPPDKAQADEATPAGFQGPAAPQTGTP